MAICVVIVEDHTIVRRGLRSVLSRISGIEVVAEAGDGEEAVRLVRSFKPDVVIMDAVLPKLFGAEATRRILTSVKGVRVIGLSGYVEEEYRDAMLAAGASAYLQKTCSVADLTDAIRAAVTTEVHCSDSPPPLQEESSRDAARNDEDGRGLDEHDAALSERERQVLQLVAEGASTRDIANRLHLSVKTIESHRRNVMQKLSIFSIAGLTKYAVQEGLTKPDP